MTGSCASGQKNDGSSATFIAQHWIVAVGGWHYQSGTDGGKNCASRTRGTTNTFGYTQVGETQKDDTSLLSFVTEWNKNPGRYCLATNSCQHFSTAFIHSACNGMFQIPQQGGVTFLAEKGKGLHAHVGLGEVLSTRAGGVVDAHIAGPGAGMHLDKGGVKYTAEACDVKAKVGPVGVNFSPNVNTGINASDGRNLEVTALGFGGKLGKDGVGIKTPLGGAECNIQ